MFTKKIHLIFLCFFVIGCTDGHKSQYSKSFSTIKNKSDVDLDSSFLFKYPDNQDISNLFVIDSSLILVNRGAHDKDSLFHEYSINTNQCKGKFVKQGIDFGEVYSPMSVGFKDGFFFVSDITTSKVLLISRDRKQKKEYKLPHFVYSIQMVDSINILESGYYDKQSLIEKVNGETGESLGEFGSFDYPSKDFHVNYWKAGYESFLFLKPDASMAVLAGRFTDLIRIVNLVTKEVVSISGPENFRPEFMPDKEVSTDFYGKILTDKTRLGFIGGNCTDKYIYMLYSGKENNNGDFSSNIILVYDWEGTPLREITLSKPVQNVFITQDNNTLYTLDSSSKTITKTNDFKQYL